MKIVVDIVKKKFEAKTKYDLLKKIGAADYCYGNDKNFSRDYKSRVLMSSDKKTIRLYSIQKFNPKTKVVTKKITRGINKGKVLTSREQVRAGHWEAYVLDLPAAFVKEAKQNDKNYTVDFNTVIKF